MNKDQFTKAIRRVYKDPQPLQIEMTKGQAWELICVVQLASRHPHAPKSMTIQNASETIRQVGHVLGANDRDLAMLIEMGWNREFDQT